MLLKNEGGVLPSGSRTRVAFGGICAKPRFQGAGPRINAFRAEARLGGGPRDGVWCNTPGAFRPGATTA